VERWVAATHPIISMGLLTGTVQNWLAVQNVIRILVTIYIQNLLPACRPIFKPCGRYTAVQYMYMFLLHTHDSTMQAVPWYAFAGEGLVALAAGSTPSGMVAAATGLALLRRWLRESPAVAALSRVSWQAAASAAVCTGGSLTFLTQCTAATVAAAAAPSNPFSQRPPSGRQQIPSSDTVTRQVVHSSGQAKREEEGPYYPTTMAQIHSVAANELALARDEAAAFSSWWAASGGGSAGDKPAGVPPMLYVLADSLSIDYGPHLQHALQGCFLYDRKNLRSAKGFCRAWLPGLGIGEGARDLVANPGIDGCNGGDSSHMLGFLRHLAATTASVSSDGGSVSWRKPAVVVLNSGLWDVKTDPASNGKAVSLEEYRRNIEQSVRICREQLGARMVIWVLTTPVDDHKHNVVFKQSWRRHNRDIVEYNAAAAEVMRGLAVQVVDMYSFTAEKLGSSSGRDHGHMVLSASQAQGAFLARQVMRLVRTAPLDA
jgi:hypothetical protein